MLTTAFCAALAHAQVLGDLVITPTRVLLDDHNHSSDITLLNRSVKPIRYRLNLVDMEMSETGRMSRLAEASETSAARFLRLAPREISLQPGEAQRIKIASIQEGLPEGELRSHISFEPVTISKPTSQRLETEGLSLNFELRSVITIPVILRRGKVGAAVTIPEAELGKDDQGNCARFKLTRTGNRSVRGDVTVWFVPKGKAPKTLLALIAGLPVYVPNKSREVLVRLSSDPWKLGQGAVEILFAEPERIRGSASASFLIEAPPGRQ